MKLRLSHPHAGADSALDQALHPSAGTERVARSTVEKRMGSGALLLFLSGSFLAHGVAYAALAGLPSNPGHGPQNVEIEFAVLQPVDEPEPVAMPEPPAVPVTPVPTAVRTKRPETASKPKPSPVAPSAATPEATPAEEASPAPLVLGSSTEGGLAVGGVVGTGTAPGAAGGKATSAPPVPAPSIDLVPITKEWMSRVSLAITERALRDYPRAALRANVQGSVLLAVQIDIHGRLAAVEVKQSSGHAQLDEAALAAARALGELPAPPQALHSRLRPFRIPINYRIQ